MVANVHLLGRIFSRKTRGHKIDNKRGVFLASVPDLATFTKEFFCEQHVSIKLTKKAKMFLLKSQARNPCYTRKLGMY
jgi:hypothetical protein